MLEWKNNEFTSSLWSICLEILIQKWTKDVSVCFGLIWKKGRLIHQFFLLKVIYYKFFFEFCVRVWMVSAAENLKKHNNNFQMS